MNFRKTLTFLYAGIILFTAGCAINATHPKYKVGQIYETMNESFVVFKYAAFIWQDPRDYQKIGYLYPFRSNPGAQEYQQEIKEKKAMEFEGMGSIAGGWTVYVPNGSKFKISRVYSLIPSIDTAIIIEVIFLDGTIKGKHIKLSYLFQYSNDVKLIE